MEHCAMQPLGLLVLGIHWLSLPLWLVYHSRSCLSLASWLMTLHQPSLTTSPPLTQFNHENLMVNWPCPRVSSAYVSSVAPRRSSGARPRSLAVPRDLAGGRLGAQLSSCWASPRFRLDIWGFHDSAVHY